MNMSLAFSRRVAAAFLLGWGFAAPSEANLVSPVFETIIEAENVTAGQVFVVVLRNLASICPFHTEPATPSTRLDGNNLDVHIYFDQLPFVSPGCLRPETRHSFPAPRRPGTYQVRVFITDRIVVNPPDPRLLIAERSIEILPPLPIPATHLWAEGLMALSLLGLGTAFARLRARA